MSQDQFEPEPPAEVDFETQLSVAREIALRQLTTRARSREELRKALAKRNVPEAVALAVLERFSEVGLLDDKSFAQSVATSGRNRLRSRRVIVQDLRGKGVAEDEIETALEQFPAEADYDSALALATKKARTMTGLDRQTAYRRLGGMLARRGFSGEVVARVLREVLDELA
ncbi:MAG: recombination regulator RecX [Propionibacteriaceae bacterium]|jgi:regulatory protein|nr:recombination regulator RecX [Propionibacteriaceae bacterium]